jgi:hypothetical protein
MATNEILPFASTNTGTNLLTQAEYTSDAQRSIGHQPGIARSKLENKVLRQASLIAAGVAEFIADYQANNVTDSLTPQNVADYLLAAITANIPVVPDASTTVKGKIEIATSAEAQAYSSSLLAITPATMNQALKGSNQSLSDNGFQRLPGGLVLQWGRTGTISSNATITVTFPVSFPIACVNVVNSVNYTVDGDINEVCHISDLSVNSYRVRNSNPQSTRTYWYAIGY